MQNSNYCKQLETIEAGNKGKGRGENMISEIMPPPLEAGDKELVKIDKEKIVTIVNNLKQMKPQTKFFGTFFL